jgi:hypothetical protein
MPENIWVYRTGAQYLCWRILLSWFSYNELSYFYSQSQLDTALLI